MRKELLKGEATILIKKMKENNAIFRKMAKRSPWIVLLGMVVGIIMLFFTFPSLSECKVYLMPLFLSLIAIVGALNFGFYTYVVKKNRELVNNAFTENKRLIENLFTVYEDEPEIRAMMEVLIVGCDISYKEDKQKVDKVVKRLMKDVS